MSLPDLITRVEQGSGSDRQLDADICVALQWGVNEVEHGEYQICEHPLYLGWLSYGPIDNADSIIAPHLTSSIGAVRALFKARLEGCGNFIFLPHEGEPTASTWLGVYSLDNELKVVHPDIHRAFLSATLKAIAAKEGK